MLHISRRVLGTVAIGATGIIAFGGAVLAAQDKYTVAVPGGPSFAEFRGYENWQMVSVSGHEGIIDVILGNADTIRAYQSGIPANGKPFPDGARLAKIHWNSKKFSDAFPVQAPDTLHDVDFMVRDARRFPGADHWGYAQFNYDARTESFSPLGTGPNCGTACHAAASGRDYVFTEYPMR